MYRPSVVAEGQGGPAGLGRYQLQQHTAWVRAAAIRMGAGWQRHAEQPAQRPDCSQHGQRLLPCSTCMERQAFPSHSPPLLAPIGTATVRQLALPCGL